MPLIKVRLIKRTTDDGLVEVEDHIEVGKEYVAEVDTKSMVDGFNVDKNKLWEREMVLCFGVPGGHEALAGWMPTEILERLDGREV